MCIFFIQIIVHSFIPRVLVHHMPCYWCDVVCAVLFTQYFLHCNLHFCLLFDWRRRWKMRYLLRSWFCVVDCVVGCIVGGFWLREVDMSIIGWLQIACRRWLLVYCHFIRCVGWLLCLDSFAIVCVLLSNHCWLLCGLIQCWVMVLLLFCTLPKCFCRR